MNGKSVSDEISLYIHLPFCKKKCPYCHFYVVHDNEALKNRLLDALFIEWHRIKDTITQNRLVSVYFGGGTPALFGPKRIAALLNEITKEAHLDDHIEVTLEANPETASKSVLSQYHCLGINRLSLGVQSVNDDLLHILGRTHSADGAKKAVFDAYESGFSNITVDLMYELPKQTIQIWQESLDEVCTWPISHISLYNLTIEAHTVFEKKKKTLLPLLPSHEEGAAMYAQAIETLEKHDFMQYEISAFCKDNKYSKHNTGYWQGRSFFGMGPSAFSFYESARFQNVSNLQRYAKALENNQSPVDFVEIVEPKARKKELLAIALRMRTGVEIADFEQQFGPLDDETRVSLNALEKDELVRQEKGRLFLTTKGVFFYDTVASELV